MREPKCPYFGKCGGCETQHIEHELQIRNKLRNVSALLKIPEEKIEVFEGNEFNYRNRMDFVFNKYGIGLREKKKWYRIVDVESCAISNEKLNKLLQETRDFFRNIDYFDIDKRVGTFKYAVIRTAIDTCITFILNEDSGRKSESIEKIREFPRISTADNIIFGYVPAENSDSISNKFEVIKGNELLHENFLGKEFFFHSQGFFQNNPAMAGKMIDYVRKKLSSEKGHLLDLYGGVGTFGLCMDSVFEKVTIVENAGMSVECARKNIEINNIKNAEAFPIDAKKIDSVDFLNPLHVIADPPRTGMDKVALRRLLDLKAETIIYVSCNPSQFAIELPKFIKEDYKVESIALFDLFPQTNHVEIVVGMRKGH